MTTTSWPCLARRDGALGHVAHALDLADRGAAVLLDDERHVLLEPREIRRRSLGTGEAMSTHGDGESLYAAVSLTIPLHPRRDSRPREGPEEQSHAEDHGRAGVGGGRWRIRCVPGLRRPQAGAEQPGDDRPAALHARRIGRRQERDRQGDLQRLPRHPRPHQPPDAAHAHHRRAGAHRVQRPVGEPQRDRRRQLHGHERCHVHRGRLVQVRGRHWLDDLRRGRDCAGKRRNRRVPPGRARTRRRRPHLRRRHSLLRGRRLANLPRRRPRLHAASRVERPGRPEPHPHPPARRRRAQHRPHRGHARDRPGPAGSRPSPIRRSTRRA